MASIINATTTNGVAISADNSGILQLATNSGTTAVTIDASQNVGIGTATLTSAKTTIYSASGSSDVGATNNAMYLNVGTPATTGNYIRFAGAVTTDLYYGRAVNSDAFVWGKVGGAESMRIDSSGNVLIGTTTLNQANTAGYAFNSQYLSIGHVNGTAGGALYQSFSYNGSAIGYISQNGTTAVQYVTSSDYRLKENVQPMVGALDKVEQLKPCTYKWKSDGSNGQGFIAHELQAVVPDCVTGEKDAVDAEGNPQYQGIDTSFLVATLTSAIQELKAIIDTQQQRITALEAK